VPSYNLKDYSTLLEIIPSYNLFLDYNNIDKINYIIKALDKVLKFSKEFKEDSYLRSLISFNFSNSKALDFLLKLRYLVLLELNRSKENLYTSLLGKF
jgi:hypothetical protein